MHILATLASSETARAPSGYLEILIPNSKQRDDKPGIHSRSHIDYARNMGAIAQSLFNGFFRRNYVFLSTVFIGAFAFEMAFDTGTDAMWNRINRGRQWQDIKQRYLNPPDEEEE